MQLILQGQSQFPTEGDFRLMEIHLYLLQDRYKEALTAATAAQQIWPSDDEIAYVYGSVLDSLGRKREALAVMESIVARNPEDYQALNYVGYSLAEQGKDLDRAVLLLEAALKQAPDRAYILDSLAWAHFRRGENAEAWELVRRATSLPRRRRSHHMGTLRRHCQRPRAQKRSAHRMGTGPRTGPPES